MPEVTRLLPTIPQLPERKKVAAYARVSLETEQLAHSLSTQISYYNDLIQKNPEWEFAGIYADRFISGTSTKNRAELNRMIKDCEAGKIDIVLCKSISRLARNTVDLLNVVRHLKGLGVSVRFEKENIDSLTSEGELMLTIFAGFAEEESKSISSNLKWAFRKKFENGEAWWSPAFGYRYENKTFCVNEKEAKAVRFVFDEYLKGTPIRTIARKVREMGFESFSGSGVKGMLENRVYTGDVITQKYYVEDPLTHKLVKNNGELPRYLIENNHEPIISHDVFNEVQKKINANRALNTAANQITKPSPFTKKIYCWKCGCTFTKGYISSNGQPNWGCGGKKTKGVAHCDSRSIVEWRLKEACCGIMKTKEFDEDEFGRQVERIDTTSGEELIFRFYDGRTETAAITYFDKTVRKEDPHHPFLGYRWKLGEGYVVVPEEAAMVRRMYQLYAEGHSFSEIRKTLLEEGFKGLRGKVSVHSLRNAIDSNLYIGNRTVKGKYTDSGEDETIENDHEPIVSMELDGLVKERRRKSKEVDARRKSK